MTISFTRTREQLRNLVLGKLGVLAASGTPTAEDSALVYEGVDLRLKEIHRLGIFWRKVGSPFSFTITASATNCSATADILFPIALKIVDGGNEEDVRIVGKREYALIENKAETGLPIKALWNGSAGFTLWPVPLTTTTGKLLYEKYADDTAASTAPDVDVAMLRWLKDIVAYDLGDHFGISEAKMERWAKDSRAAEINIRRLAVEHVDYKPVAVDGYDYGETATKHDWNTA